MSWRLHSHADRNEGNKKVRVNSNRKSDSEASGALANLTSHPTYQIHWPHTYGHDPALHESGFCSRFFGWN